MPRKSTVMTDAHKKALSAGRLQSRAVKEYLEALEANKPRRGRRRTTESIQARLTAIEEELGEASALQRLLLVQEQSDLEFELENREVAVDITTFEKAFIKHANAYAETKGITYATFRAVGVPAEILRRAGIGRAG